jgi:hypothetical protein
LWGSYTAFVPGHDLVGYYLYWPCELYPDQIMSTANQTIANTSGNGTIPPAAVTDLSADVTYCTQACVIDLDANATMGDPVGPVCGGILAFSWTSVVRRDTACFSARPLLPESRAFCLLSLVPNRVRWAFNLLTMTLFYSRPHTRQNPYVESPTDIKPQNATLQGNWTELPQGHNISYYYQWAPCSQYSANLSTSPVMVILNASDTGSLPPYTVGELEPSTTYCVSMCMQDDTAGSGFTCSTPTNFTTLKAPEVITLPATNVGVSNSSTLQGEYNSFIPGDTLMYYHLLAPCATYNDSVEIVGNGTILNSPGNGTLPAEVVGPLQAGLEYCTQACIVGVASNFGLPVCGQVYTFSWTAVVRAMSEQHPLWGKHHHHTKPLSLTNHHFTTKQYAVTNNATNVSPSSAELSGSYGDLPAGHAISYYYSWGLCTSYPNTSTSSNISSISNPGLSGALPPLQLLGLLSSAVYCYQVRFSLPYHKRFCTS